MIKLKSYKESMKIGSHNSWSFNKVKQWYLKPFFWIAKCQNADICRQYLMGIRCFDLRLRYNHKKKIFETAHGLITYCGEEHWKNDIEWLNELTHNAVPLMGKIQQVYCRVLLETKNFDEEEKQAFFDLCLWLERNFKDVKFFGGFPTRHWKQNIYNFTYMEPLLADKYASVIPPKIRGLWPWLYAHNHNKENVSAPAKSDFLYIDFVEDNGSF